MYLEVDSEVNYGLFGYETAPYMDPSDTDIQTSLNSLNSFVIVAYAPLVAKIELLGAVNDF